ncbi:hypothetical protein AQUCO_03400126v1 [Aquilegia coerulea]|uniref:Pentatricopeptide repeat-containing protein n=1 Tax=Aquilegia coerulea TaxID=218851 RepID=A0A2G5CXM1_AQUCA|nr:hypothetical protein AQUCO_03400126v1 [Aquilegia coerulea]
MYGKCGLVEFSRKLSDEMPDRNVISWMHDCGYEEFEKPDEFAFATVLTGCAGIQDLKLGMQVHAGVMIAGFEEECAFAICNMYLRCGEVSAAENILRERGENALLKIMMIKGYVYNGRHHDALRLIASTNNSIRMVINDLSVVVSVLTACADVSLLRIGRQIHGVIIPLLGLHSNFQSEDAVTVILSALIDMYCKCSSIGEAQRVFDNQTPPQDVSHWNAMITGYINNGLLNDAIWCFIQVPERNVVSWTAMISGYVDYSLPHEGLQLLAEMYSNKDGIVVQGNCVTFAVALEAASLLTALESGKQIHAKLIRMAVKADTHNVIVGTALLDMYSKSGNLIYAQTVFVRMMEKNVVSWTSMITGYATHGLGFQALDLFQQMMAIGIEPNEVTFVSVLTSCSHCGLVEEGMKYFKLMTDKYKIVPRSDHYACVVDLLGRAGKLTESFKLLEKIEEEETSSEVYGGAIWGALLGACTLYGNVELGNMVAVKMLEKKQQVAETCIALSNIYAAAGMWDEAFKVREIWGKSSDVGKPGQSRIFIHHATPQS